MSRFTRSDADFGYRLLGLVDKIQAEGLEGNAFTWQPTEGEICRWKGAANVHGNDLHVVVQSVDGRRVNIREVDPVTLKTQPQEWTLPWAEDTGHPDPRMRFKSNGQLRSTQLGWLRG